MPDFHDALAMELRGAGGDPRRVNTRDARARRSGRPLASLSHNRPLILIPAAVLLVVGAIVTLSTKRWWALAGALALDVRSRRPSASHQRECRARFERLVCRCASRLPGGVDLVELEQADALGSWADHHGGVTARRFAPAAER
jgi:hypothetical protein